MYGLPVLLIVSYLSSPLSLPWQPSQTYQVQVQILLVNVKSLSGQFINCLISIKSYVCWHLYQLDLVVFCQFHQELMVVPGWFGSYLEAVKGLDGCLTVRMNIDVPTCVAFSVFSIMQTLMAYISAWYIVVWSPRLKLCPLLKPHLYTPAPVPFLVLFPSVYQTRLPFLSGLNLFCHSHLSTNLTVNVLWYTYLRSIPSDPIWRLGSTPYPETFWCDRS